MIKVIASFSEHQITVNAISLGWIETGEYEHDV